jgi:hypothetical protein
MEMNVSGGLLLSFYVKAEITGLKVQDFYVLCTALQNL